MIRKPERSTLHTFFAPKESRHYLANRHSAKKSGRHAEAAKALLTRRSRALERVPLPIDWGRFLPEHTTAVSMLDRLLHRSVVLNLDGDSYRLREHHARGEALRAATTGTRQPLR